MRKSHTNIVKFLNLLPEISPYAQTDGADNNKTPTHVQIDANQAKQMSESEWTASKCKS